MKRTLFITIGAVALFLIFALWLYLLLFGTPRSVSEVVGDFGFGDVTVTPIVPSDPMDSETTRQLDLAADATLYQLTSKPVAGASILDAEDGTHVLYAERGTGHIYQIDIATRGETRLSQKTYVGVNRAFFAPDGSVVVLMADTVAGTTAYLQEIRGERVERDLPQNAANIAFLPDRKLAYTVTGQNGTVGYTYDLASSVIAQVFSTPLRDVRIIWNTEGPLLYPRTAPQLSGRIYVTTANSLTPSEATGLSFSAITSAVFADLKIETYTHPKSGNLVSYASLAETDHIPLGTTALPEKCAFDPNSMTLVWCASQMGLVKPQEQADWYKGRLSFTDSLWKIDLADGGRAIMVDDLTKNSGRQIDVVDLQISASSDALLFKNKNDDTLWLKRLSRPESAVDLNSTADEELLGDSEEVTDGEI